MKFGKLEKAWRTYTSVNIRKKSIIKRNLAWMVICGWWLSVLLQAKKQL